MRIISSLIFISIFGCCVCTTVSKKVPKHLLIGTATSSYQVEGAWKEDGKSESIWDHLVHTQPEKIADRSNGDIACDAYHKIKSDVALLKSTGFQYYRFSISWPRIIPSGISGSINMKGIAYYNELINELLKNGIKPLATIYHWDLPQSLQDLGGWTNPLIVKWFEDYSDVVLRNFGDRVKFWITINEPRLICQMGYGDGVTAPALNTSGVGDYLCARNLLLAHARVYHLYKKKYQKSQKGLIGITIDAGWSEPATNSSADREAAERNMQFEFGIYAHPIFSKKGDFPSTLKEFVAKRSRSEGFKESRLPEFTLNEISYIRGSSDFYGLNYYTSYYVKDRLPDPIGLPTKNSDLRVDSYQDPSWLTGSFEMFKSVPWGFGKLLNYIKQSYGNPEIYITENGFPDVGELDDQKRIKYLRENIAAVLDAIKYDGVRVRAYTVWSFLDNFEWANGYTVRFGIFNVDFNDPNRPRTPKRSSEFFKTLIRTRQLKYEV